MQTKSLKFTISGKTAFFKEPSVNKIYLSYNSIHKMNVYGIIGAIMGYQGYDNVVIKKKNNKTTIKLPEFYEKLKNIEVSIIENKIPIKKNHFYSCTTGHANDRATLLVEEEWLEDVSWDIYLKTEDENFLNEIYDKISSYKWERFPYLGNNSHFCNITNIEMVEIEEVEDNEDIRIDSLFILPSDFEYEEQNMRIFSLPVGFYEDIWFYKEEYFAISNEDFNNVENLYTINDRVIQFF